MDHQEKLDRYIKGQLQGTDLTDFQREINNNPMLAKEVKKHQVIAKGIEAYGNEKLKQHLKQFRAGMLEESKPQKKSTGKIIRFIIAAAAAVAFLIFMRQLWPQAATSQQLFAQSYEVYDASFSSRDTDAAIDLAQAEKLYKSKAYQQAIPLLENAVQQQSTNAQLQLALGNAYLLNEQAPKAIPLFQSIINRNDALYGDQAKWYLALTYLKLEQTANCKQLIEQLASNPEADFHQEAKALLVQL